VGSVLVISTPAFAAPVKGASSGSNAGNFICSANINTNSNAANNLLPIDRWGNVSGSEFTYLAGGLTGTVENLGKQTNRAMVGIGLSVGNALWDATSSLTTIAEQFCFGSQAGAAANSIATSLWNFFSSSGVIAILAGVGLVILFWQARKGKKIVGELIRILMIVSIMAMLGITSSKTTTYDAKTGKYPAGSPAWIVSTAYSAVTAVVSVPLAGINKLTSSVQLTGASSPTSSGLSCPSYVNALLKQYQQTYGPNTASQSAAVVPEMVNDIWDSSGLQATAIAQFGDNPYTEQAYCHLYEEESGIAPAQQLALTQKAGPIPPGANSSSLAFLPAGSPSSEVVASIVGWAACTQPGSSKLGPYGQWTSVIDSPSPGLAQQVLNTVGGAAALNNPVSSSSQTSPPRMLTASDCQHWWSTPVSSFPYTGTALWWGTTASVIASGTTHAPQVGNFLMNFFGDSSNGATIISIVYVLASLAVLLVFGVLSLAVIIAKFGLLLLMAMFIIFLIVDLVPTRNGGHHSSKFIKQGLSFLLLAVGAEAILGMVALLTNVIDRFGVGVAGSGLIGMLWIALSPVAAIWGVHHILKTFRVPSPFRPDAAMGWAAAAGAGGFLTGAIGEKVAGAFHRARATGSGGVRQGGRSMLGRFSTRPEQRPYAPRLKPTANRMPPVDTLKSGGRTRPTPQGGPPTTHPTNDRIPSTAASASSAQQAATAQVESSTEAPARAKGRLRTWLSKPATSPTMINGQPYRSPRDMRLEGAQKLASQRAHIREAKKFIKAQGPNTRRGRAQEALSSRARLAYARFQSHPGKSVTRAAAYTAVALAAPVSLPVAVGAVGAHFAVKKIRTARSERPAAKAERRAQIDYAARRIVANPTNHAEQAQNTGKAMASKTAQATRTTKQKNRYAGYI
jgi:hypothetical protein